MLHYKIEWIPTVPVPSVQAVGRMPVFRGPPEFPEAAHGRRRRGQGTAPGDRARPGGVHPTRTPLPGQATEAEGE